MIPRVVPWTRKVTTESLLRAGRRHGSSAVDGSPLSPRWLSDIKSRIGYCITWGLSRTQAKEAGDILQVLARDWRELLAGSEGFDTTWTRKRHVVWGEQDSMGHVNNVQYNRYAETSRVEWFTIYAAHQDPANASRWRELVTPKGDGLILRNITTEFKFPLKYPDQVYTFHKVKEEPTEGTDAFKFEVLILSGVHQRAAARCTEENVLYDYQRSKRITPHPFMLDFLRRTWETQEQTKQRNSARVLGLLERLRKLEQDSWDREGAVEDFGSASS